MSIAAVKSAIAAHILRFIAHARATAPSLRLALGGGLMWAALMGMSAALSVWMQGWATPEKYFFLARIFALSGAVAFPFGLWLAAMLGKGKRPETRFAAAFVCLTIVTLGVTASAYALDYRQYYAKWHADVFTITWIYQFVFTIAGALVQFAVMGVRLFFPLGFAAVAVASIWFARQKN